MDLKMSSDGKESSGTGQQNTTACQAVLLIAGATPFVTASLSAATEVFDGTAGGSGGLTTAVNYGFTIDLAAGTATVIRSGLYDIELSLDDFSNGSAAGNVTFDVQKNSAAFSGNDVMSVTRVAATAKAGLVLERRVALVKGDVIRARVTNSGAGGAVTVTGGSLRITQVADSITNKVAPV
jgi:hypothetical protein